MNKASLYSIGLSLLCSRLCAEPQAMNALPLRPAATQSIFFNAALSMLLAVILLALVFYGLLWWRKRFISDPVIANELAPIIKGSRRLTQKTTLLTVTWQGRVYLLAETQGSLSVLDSVPIEVKTS